MSEEPAVEKGAELEEGEGGTLFSLGRQLPIRGSKRPVLEKKEVEVKRDEDAWHKTSVTQNL